MGVTPLKRAVLSGGFLVTYKIHNLQAPPGCVTQCNSTLPPNLGTKLGQPNNREIRLKIPFRIKVEYGQSPQFRGRWAIRFKIRFR